MKKILLIIFGIVSIGIFATGITLLMLSQKDKVTSDNETPTTFPISDTPRPIPGEPIGILEREETVPLQGGNYIIAGGNSLAQIPPYQIIYSEYDDSYTISLQREPLERARLDAENELLDLLDISAEDACSLRVVVSVPYSVSESQSGINFGLSFCPGAVSL